MSNLADKILQKIEKQNIEPIAKWKFFLKNTVLWGITALFFILGIFVSALLFVVADHLELWNLLVEKPMLVLSIGIFGILFFWGGMSVVFSLLSQFSLNNTKTGYKYSISSILWGLFAVQIFSGLALAHFSHDSLPAPEKLPFYDQLTHEREKIWMHPEEGFLAGKIQKISESEISILDKKRNPWTVHITTKTQYPKNFTLKKGEEIRVLGNISDSENKIFLAEKIFPMKGMRRKMHPERKPFFLLSPEEKREKREKMEDHIREQ